MKFDPIDKNIKKIKGKRVFVRLDLNVPISKGKIKDEKKIIAALPTIRYLLRYKTRLIIATHLGRPEGKANARYSVKPIAKRLKSLLGGKVEYINDVCGEKALKKAKQLKEGRALFIENLRFDKREKKNDKKFAKELAMMADVYVNDAFSVAHRAHASVCAIKKFLPAFEGLLLISEIKNLDKINRPKRPLVVIMGGAKIKTKIALIKKLEPKASSILIGGALANNFFKARKMEIGESLVDKESIKIAKRSKSKKIILPIDVVVKSRGKAVLKRLDEVGKKDKIFDIGPKTIKLYSGSIKKAKTLVWNGPLGLFEEDAYKHGTLSIAQAFAGRAKGPAFGVVGGGETIQALKKAGVEDYIDWVSTGGGAMLAYLGGEKMPGLEK
ncbi:phosphoglycerate kinase [Candidatus Falkowbacteria bacterium]|nr:phosphoglycerate kinase [Candidatus Falkowbacteria bacterium]